MFHGKQIKQKTDWRVSFLFYCILFFQILIFILFVCLFLHDHILHKWGCLQRTEDHPYPLELKLPVVISCTILMLETKHQSYRRTVSRVFFLNKYSWYGKVAQLVESF